MLQQVAEQRILVSSLAQRISDSDDTSFTVQLGSCITGCKRLVLQMFTCDNLFINLKDLTIYDGLDTISIIPDVFLTVDMLIPYVNEKLADNGSQLVLTLGQQYQPVYLKDQLIIGGNQPFTLIGSSWYTKLGFNDQVLSNVQRSVSPYDFTQSAMIGINLVNLPKSITNSIPCQFVVDNNTTYGQRISRYFYNYNSVQSVTFSQEQSFNRLDIQLLDEDGELLRTPNNNHSEISVIMVLSSYEA